MIYLELLYILLSLFILWRLTNCNIFPSPQFVLGVAYFAYIYLGFLLMLQDEHYQELNSLKDVAVMVRLGWISILAASIFTFKFKVSIKSVTPVNLRYYKSDEKGVNVLTCICLAISVIYILQIPSHPLGIIYSDSSLLAESRESATVGVKGFDVYSNVLYNLLPFCWLYLYLSKKKSIWLYVLLFNLFATLATGQKSPIIYLLIGYSFAHGIKNGKIDYYGIFIKFIISTIMLIALVYLQNKHLFDGLNLDAITGSSVGLFRRVFMVGPTTILNYFQVFPNMHDFLHIGGTHLPSDQLVYNEIFNDGINGTVNSISLSILYAYTGDIYLSNLIFLFILILLFMLPNLIGRFIADDIAMHSVMCLYYILIFKMVITDWYTIIPIFILNTMVIVGFLNIIFQLKYVKFNAGREIRIGSLYYIISILLLMYFSQGQAKILLAS